MQIAKQNNFRAWWALLAIFIAAVLFYAGYAAYQGSNTRLYDTPAALPTE